MELNSSLFSLFMNLPITLILHQTYILRKHNINVLAAYLKPPRSSSWSNNLAFSRSLLYLLRFVHPHAMQVKTHTNVFVKRQLTHASVSRYFLLLQHDIRCKSISCLDHITHHKIKLMTTDKKVQ